MKQTLAIAWITILFILAVIGLRTVVDIIRSSNHTSEVTVKDLWSLIILGIVFGLIIAFRIKKRQSQ